MRELKFRHELSEEDVTTICIRYNFYTRGDVKAYTKMLDMCGEVTPNKLLQIAEDIVEHSDTENNEYLASYEALDEVMYYLSQRIKTTVTR